jgi:hypothetical protein
LNTPKDSRPAALAAVQRLIEEYEAKAADKS